MKGILCTTLLLLLIVASSGQEPSAKQAPCFPWEWRDAEELGTTQVITASKDISAAERNLLLRALAGRLNYAPEASKRAAQVRIKLVDLNGDGVPEVIAQAADDYGCSPTGNCTLWVFQKTKAGYTPILEKPAIQRFRIQRSKTNGYSDLVLLQHGSVFEQDLWVYQFGNRRYRRTECYNADWQFLGKDGEYHELKEPRITRCEK